jgi:hypothetical protein
MVVVWRPLPISAPVRPPGWPPQRLLPMWTSGNGLLKSKEPITNVKPISNGLVKSVTDQSPISNGLFKSVTGCCRIGNGLYIKFVTDKFVLEMHACRMRLR